MAEKVKLMNQENMDLFSKNTPKTKSSKKKLTIDFSAVMGQTRAKNLLQQAIINKRIPSSLLFLGPEGCGKDALAIEFAKALNCRSSERVPCQTCDQCRQFSDLVHPDLRFIFAGPAKLKEDDIVKHLQKKARNYYVRSAYSSTANILIDRIRELKKNASLKLYKGKYRIFILSEADRMTVEAANSLLKLLEEPPQQLILILTTSRIDQLLPTVISRCQIIKFAPLANDEIQSKLITVGMEPRKAAVISRLSMGNFRKAISLDEESYQELREQAWQLLASKQADVLDRLDLAAIATEGKDRGMVKELFLLALLWLRDVLVYQTVEQNDGSQPTFYNSDQVEKLEQLSQLYKGVNLDKTISETEYCVDLIDKNAYITLILINYLNHLSDLRY